MLAAVAPLAKDFINSGNSLEFLSFNPQMLNEAKKVLPVQLTKSNNLILTHQIQQL
jgi:hypothetical protein